MDVAFTNHALERMQQRGISKEMVYAAIHSPDKFYPESDGDTKFIRRVNGRQVFAICKPLPEEDKWLVKSTWVRGEDDHRRPTRYRRPSNRSADVQLLVSLGLALVVILIIVYLLTR